MGIKLKIFVVLVVVSAVWYYADAITWRASWAVNKTTETFNSLNPFYNETTTGEAITNGTGGDVVVDEEAPVVLRFIDADGNTYPPWSIRVGISGNVVEEDVTVYRKVFEGYTDLGGMVKPGVTPGRYTISVEPYSYGVLIYPYKEELDLTGGSIDVVVHKRALLAPLDFRHPSGDSVDGPAPLYSGQKYYFNMRVYGDGEVLCPRVTIRPVSGVFREEDQLYIWLLAGNASLPASLNGKIIYNYSYSLGDRLAKNQAGVYPSAVFVLQAERIYSQGEAELSLGDCMGIVEKSIRLKLMP